MSLLIIGLVVAVCISVVESLKRRRAEELAERGEDFTLEASKPPLIRPGFVWGLVLIYGAFWFLLNGWMIWPPRWLERSHERKEVVKRVESVGGWNRLVADTTTMLATNDWRGLDVHPGFDTNIVLPESIAALKARTIVLNKIEGQSTALFRLYSTSRGRPKYWLYVATEGSEEKAVDQVRHHWPSLTTFKQITNGVFEVY